MGQSYIHFKLRNGEAVGGAVTFFILLSFCPIMLLMISLYGHVIGDNALAGTQVLASLKSMFPQISPWIMQSVEGVIKSQMKSGVGMNLMNIAVLTYACLGVSSAVNFGIDVISHQDPAGCFFWEDWKALWVGAVLSLFLVVLMLVSQEGLVLPWLRAHAAVDFKQSKFLLQSNVLQAVLSLVFFTLLYKFAPAIKVKFKDAMLGSLVFVTCFFVGKYGYQLLYLQDAKEDLAQSFGNFYTLVLAVLWVYYVLCSFFYGACIAYVHYKPEAESVLTVELPDLPPMRDSA